MNFSIEIILCYDLINLKLKIIFKETITKTIKSNYEKVLVSLDIKIGGARSLKSTKLNNLESIRNLMYTQEQLTYDGISDDYFWEKYSFLKGDAHELHESFVGMSLTCDESIIDEDFSST